jgi:hypothetical protein
VPKSRRPATPQTLRTVLSLVRGAMIAPMEGVYGDQEGHTSSAFERALRGGGIDCLFDELKKALTERLLNAQADDQLITEAPSCG